MELWNCRIVELWERSVKYCKPNNYEEGMRFKTLSCINLSFESSRGCSLGEENWVCLYEIFVHRAWTNCPLLKQCAVIGIYKHMHLNRWRFVSERPSEFHSVSVVSSEASWETLITGTNQIDLRCWCWECGSRSANSCSGTTVPDFYKISEDTYCCCCWAELFQ